jgi:integrase
MTQLNHAGFLWRNTYLKEVGKAGGRVNETFSNHDLISTHTARRSFATNLYNSGFPLYYIMKITGKGLLRYIKVDKDGAAKKLMEY